MPTYSKCDKTDPTVRKVCNEVLEEFESHSPLIEREVKLDLMFAHADLDDVTQKPKNDAITKNGRRVYGQTRILNLKDRAKGLGDCEILIDGDWWHEAGPDERRALIDHELYHIATSTKSDDLGRPKLRLRKHDVEVGWFNVVATRHGVHSFERVQAASLMEELGQYYWPEIAQSNGSRMTKLDVGESAKQLVKTIASAGGGSISSGDTTVNIPAR